MFAHVLSCLNTTEIQGFMHTFQSAVPLSEPFTLTQVQSNISPRYFPSPRHGEPLMVLLAKAFLLILDEIYSKTCTFFNIHTSMYNRLAYTHLNII